MNPQAPGEKPERTPNALDREVGTQLRLRRSMLGISAVQFAQTIGVSAENLSDYESGRSRLSVELLIVSAHALGVPLGWFFETLSPSTNLLDDTRPALTDEEIEIELMQLFHEMSPHQKLRLLGMAKVFRKLS